jgi:hypothetical protein
MVVDKTWTEKKLHGSVKNNFVFLAFVFFIVKDSTAAYLFSTTILGLYVISHPLPYQNC